MLKRIEMGGFPAGLINRGCLIGNPHHTSLRQEQFLSNVCNLPRSWTRSVKQLPNGLEITPIGIRPSMADCSFPGRIDAIGCHRCHLWQVFKLVDVGLLWVHRQGNQDGVGLQVRHDFMTSWTNEVYRSHLTSCRADWQWSQCVPVSSSLQKDGSCLWGYDEFFRIIRRWSPKLLMKQAELAERSSASTIYGAKVHCLVWPSPQRRLATTSWRLQLSPCHVFLCFEHRDIWATALICVYGK